MCVRVGGGMRNEPKEILVWVYGITLIISRPRSTVCPGALGCRATLIGLGILGFKSVLYQDAHYRN